MNIIQLIDESINAAILAGIEIRKIYSLADFGVQLKEDQTPVTLADQNAHTIILKILESTGLPVLSEEGIHLNYPERKNWDLFWMVDPLDGTKEFIKRNDEFTVNIALIQNYSTIYGVIYSPISRELFVGIPGTGAYKFLNPDERCTFQTIQSSGIKLQAKTKTDEFIVAVSRSHMNRKTEDYIENLRNENEPIRIISKGSSLKFCLIAEGDATIYPKFGTTMEWDTAAGHAILKAVGKNILLPDLKTELTYNKENLENPHFIAI
jgi:3'(2'), 5'-bisphosphate nucleotidase